MRELGLMCSGVCRLLGLLLLLLTLSLYLLFWSLLFFSRLFFTILLYSILVTGGLHNASVCFYGRVSVACVIAAIAYIHYVASLLFFSRLFFTILLYSSLVTGGLHNVSVYFLWVCVGCLGGYFGCLPDGFAPFPFGMKSSRR